MGRVAKFLLNPLNVGKYAGGEKKEAAPTAAAPVAPQVTDQGVRDATSSARASLTSAFADTQLSDPNLLNQKRTALGAWL